MKKKIGKLSLLLFAGAMTNAMAVPTLQFNIEGGTYKGESSGYPLNLEPSPTPMAIVFSGKAKREYTPKL